MTDTTRSAAPFMRPTVRVFALAIGIAAATAIFAAPRDAAASIILTSAEATNGSFPATDGGFAISYGSGSALTTGAYAVSDVGSQFIITALDGGTFTLNAFDERNIFGGSVTITMTGTLANSSTAGDSFTTSSGTLVGETPVNLSGVSLTRLDVSGSSFAGFANVSLTEDSPASPAPEPASLALLATGLLGLAGWRRRRAG